MKIREVIARADALRMNTLSDEQKAAWVCDLDGQLAEMFGVEPYTSTWPEDDRELLMPPPYEEIYQMYLICKIDYYNQEMGLYTNDSAVYNDYMAEAVAWYRRKQRPRGSGNWRVM